MKRGMYFVAGILVGATLFGGTAAYAVGLTAESSPHRFFVDGKEVLLEAYNINGNNYCKLRDIGEVIGFNVYWDTDTGTVQMESGKPYTGTAPETEEVSVEEQPSQTESTDTDTMKQEIIDLTNQLRKENGVAALKVNDRLMEAAQVRADEMAASGTYSHTRPDGRSYSTVIDCEYAGENIGQIPLLHLEQQKVNLSERMVQMWFNSAGHQKNMLNSRYGDIGIGLSRGVDGNGLECWYCVQMFLYKGYTITWVDTPAY